MSVDWGAYAIIGVCIDVEKLYKPTEKIKNFDHDYTEDMIYDPKTGKPLWRDYRDSIDVVSGEWDDGGPDGEGDLYKLGDYRICGDEDDDVVICALVYSGDNGPNSHSYHSLYTPEEFDKFKQYLQSVGLWNEEDFGLYCILTCC